ncbi:sulfurtransferase TusA family protein [Cyanobacterium aponinum UTEX 3222]|uniref:sulfurtransferase TusA family protein n=1 Tax=Cyanobacterium aponinum TaxID=379064 RepID=UPI00308580DE|nr:sulfurtransferase TusA family protein [Cyanobacterium aponinum UTEX 3222]
MSEFVLDLRGTPCPINFIRSKLQLEKMSQGDVLEIHLDGGEPIEQVPNSLSMEGYSIEAIEDKGEYFVLSVRA